MSGFSLYADAIPSKILPPQLIVTTVDEYCDGGGIIQCQLQGATPGSTIEFRIYLLPNTNTSISVLTPANNQLTVDAGNYRIVATETIGGITNTLPFQDVTIANQIQPMDFVISHTDEHCDDGTMTISVTSGFATQYALFSGPVTAAPQATPFFGNLPDGLYVVHAIDACGNVKAHSYTVPHNDVAFTVGTMGFVPQLPACNQIMLTHPIAVVPDPNDALLFPLTFVYTIYPPNNGAPQTHTFVDVTGNTMGYTSVHTLPFWYDQLYFYDLQVIDRCGQSEGWTNIPVDLEISAGLTPELGECGQFFFSIMPSVYMPPYTINFTDAPAGFVATDFNADYPGPFLSGQTFFGEPTNTVPMGHYQGTLTDACGHTASFEQEIEENELPPTFTPHPHPGCTSDMSDLQIQTISFDIDYVVVTSAPSTYIETIPHTVPEVPNQIDEQEIWIYDLPVGDYHIIIYDTCGIAHEYDQTIDGMTFNNTPSGTIWADCNEGLGSIRIRGGNSTTLVSVRITSAPTAYNETLPHDVSLYIGPTSGIFSMEQLPPGVYTFELTNNCGNTYLQNYTIFAYQTQQSADITVTKQCSAFDVALAHTTNGTGTTYWLQKRDDNTGQWMHPATSSPYTDGSPLTTTNAIQLTNNSNNINQLFMGHFRVLKTFQSFQYGNTIPLSSTKICIEQLEEFDNTGGVEIVDIVKLTCDGAMIDVKVIADGVPPYYYKIIEKNGQPFVVDNVANDTFTNLDPAVYTFSVEHSCGQVVTKIVDIASLPSLIQAVHPTNPIYECDGDDNDGKANFNLAQFNAIIVGTQNPADFTVTYHESESEAENGTNPLPTTYYGTTSTIYGRLKLNSGSCFEVVEIELVVNPYPILNMPLRYALCPNGNVTITADSGMDGYVWSSGQTTQNITVNTIGTYTLTVSQTTNGITCTGVYQIEVFPVVTPTIHHIDYRDWTDDSNTIIVHTNESDTGDFLYSVDNGMTFQSSNVFNGLAPGEYHVVVKDLGECDSDDDVVYLLMYPKFFTPNDDGYNDYWKVKFDEFEPNIQTFIYDRYGKLITGFPVGGRWDGTYNGKLLPSTDYWFVVIRQDGRELRGHFAMKR
ncbi:T9SS type B sorting domain-containing protein [Flavobacterium sp.]|uniref:T9SS type B sorting domain-containing protein n=1 Tax=Flavobacterium sp. TaxID=239 RepID=UPI0025BEB9F7|nr:T9SS type B sorting domain-containing protein [Flavobacterium sp.]